MAAGRMALFGGAHAAILAATVLTPLALRRVTWRGVAIGLAALLSFEKIATTVIAWRDHRIAHWADVLPMHLCDWASVAVIVALVWRKQQAYELAYFWGLAGTVQALLTPDIAPDVPLELVICFFVSHCGIVIGVLYMTWGLGRRPQRGTLWRMAIWNQIYLACAGAVDVIFRTNFGYLRAKPLRASLLDVFAPWPWYILELDVIALVFYAMLYAPFWAKRRAASAGSVMGRPHV